MWAPRKFHLHGCSHLLCQADYLLFLVRCFLGELRCAAPGVSYVGYNIVGLFKHPLVTPRDGEARMDGFDAFRKHGVGVITGVKLVSFWGQTLQNDGIADVGVYRYQLFQDRAHNPIKCSLLANVKHIYSMVLDQINQNLTKFWFNWTRTITMPEECTCGHFFFLHCGLTSIADNISLHYSIR